MINNIVFEIKKILKSKIFIYSIILLFLINGLIMFYSNKNYKNSFEIKSMIPKINENEYAKYNYYSNYKDYKFQYNKYLTKINNDQKTNEYIVKNNITLNIKGKSIFEKNKIVLLFIMIPLTILGSALYSNEVNKGTIKTVLIKPNNRLKVILSKIVSLNIIGVLLILLNFLFSTIFMLFVIKSNIFTFISIINVNKELLEVNYYFHYFLNYLIVSIPILFIGNLSLILSIITSSSSISIAITIFLSLLSSFISEFLLLLKFKFIQFTFLPYLDFTIFENYINIIQFNINYGINLCLKNGIIILTLSTIFLYFLIYFYFNRKDIF